MKQEVREKWIAALRGGAYKQTSSTLHDDDGFCCLGVLCELHRIETGWQEWDWHGSDAAYGGEFTLPPAEVARWAGFGEFGMDCQGYTIDPHVTVPDKNPARKGQTRSASLAGLNDEGRTFEQIAALIEEQL